MRVSEKIIMLRLSIVLTFLFVGVLNARGGGIENAGKLLPAGARIIETTKVAETSGRSRALVLWMQHPKKEIRNPHTPYCGDSVYGDHWFEPARLSLVDPLDGRVLNTVKISGPAFLRDPADSFRVSYLVPSFYYHVPHLDSKGEGLPQILRLRDLTGDGLADEFVMFMYAFCGAASTGAFGYDRKSDRVLQYPVQVISQNGSTKTELWPDHIFCEKPIRPGHWRFAWQPGHGSDQIIHEDVSFDPERLLFVDHRRSRPLRMDKMPKASKRLQ